MAIEDPFSLKQNLSRNLLTQTNKYIINIIRKSCIYFVLNTHCIIESVSSSNANEEKTKIVEKLIGETGILDARKTNGLLDEDCDDQGEEHLDTNEHNGDDYHTGDSAEENDDDLNYFNKTKATKSKEKTKSSMKKNETVDKLNEINKEFNTLKLKFKSHSHEHLDKAISADFLIVQESSESTTPIQGHESDDLDLEEDDSEDEDSEKNGEHFLEDEETGDDVLSSTDTDECENSEDLLFKVEKKSISIETKQEFPSGNECELAAKACINYLLKRVVKINEMFYEQIPNVMIKTVKAQKQQSQIYFKLSANSIGFPRNPPLICSLCNKEGHLHMDCPQDCLPKLEELPQMTDGWREVLNKVCICIMGKRLNIFSYILMRRFKLKRKFVTHA